MTKQDILERIIQFKRSELVERKQVVPLSNLFKKLDSISSPTRSFRQVLLNNPDFHYICEIKKASPSRGIIQPDFDPLRQAEAYIRGSASAISVLTDSHFFQGSLDDLCQVRNISPIPVLRKDFIFDEYQVYEARAAGTDFILLIARILSTKEIEKFSRLAEELGMEILLEIHEEQEIRKIPDTEALIVGINNRDLRTFRVNIQNSVYLKEKIPGEIPVISESGIKNPKDCSLLKEAGLRGALIGEILMKSKNPREQIEKFRQEVNGVNKA